MFEVARIFTFSIVVSTYSTLLVKKVLNRVVPIRDDGLRPALSICNVSKSIEVL